MIYQIAEKFKSIQGEGLYVGTPMAFIRFVGCSVGKKICHACDTDFDKTYSWRGGGEFSDTQLRDWVAEYDHVCLTGGEPLDHDLVPLIKTASYKAWHVETSGTKPIEFLGLDHWRKPYVCVSPKPGFLESAIEMANEIKVIVPGLGSGEGWPTLEDAARWAGEGKIVYLQPRNSKFDVDQNNLRIVQDIITEYPQFRLSVQMHKILKVQ